MSLSQAVQMLPTPQATNATASSTGYGANLHEVARELLPTPKAGDAVMGLPRTSGRPPEKSTHLATRLEYTDYGMYAPAIARWEQVLGRPAPAPTIPPTREGGASAALDSFRRMAHGFARGACDRRGSGADARAAAPPPRKWGRPAAGRRRYLSAHQDRP